MSTPANQFPPTPQEWLGALIYLSRDLHGFSGDSVRMTRDNLTKINIKTHVIDVLITMKTALQGGENPNLYRKFTELKSDLRSQVMKRVDFLRSGIITGLYDPWSKIAKDLPPEQKHPFQIASAHLQDIYFLLEEVGKHQLTDEISFWSGDLTKFREDLPKYIGLVKDSAKAQKYNQKILSILSEFEDAIKKNDSKAIVDLCEKHRIKDNTPKKQ